MSQDHGAVTHGNVEIEWFYHQDTGTLTYLVWCAKTKMCAIVDPVMDFDIRHATATFETAKKYLARIAELGLKVQWLLETHPAADHPTSCSWLKAELTKLQPECPPKSAIGEHLTDVIAYWGKVFNLSDVDPTGKAAFDCLWKEGDTFKIGETINVEVLYTPGHTPSCTSLYIKDTGAKTADGSVPLGIVLCGDTIFAPPIGNARADFPAGSPATLFRSARRLLSLPPDTLLYVGHDYPESGPPVPANSVKVHREKNCTLNDKVEEHEFVAANSEKLPIPRLLLPSIQLNLRAGGFGKPEEGGRCYIKLPINCTAEFSCLK